MKKSRKSYYIIEDRVNLDGKLITKSIRYLGTAQKLLDNLKELDQLRKQKSLTK